MSAPRASLAGLTALIAALVLFVAFADESGGELAVGARGTPAPRADGDTAEVRATQGARRAVSDERSDRGSTEELAAASQSAALRVLVRWDDGTPAVGVGVLVVEVQRGRPAAASGVYRAVTGGDGVARLMGLMPALHRVLVLHAPAEQVALAPSARTDLEFRIARGPGIEGRVVDAFGGPVPGAALWLTPPGGQVDHENAVIAAHAGDGGRFRIDGVGLPVNAWLAARAPGHGASAWRNLVALRDDDVPGGLRGVELRLGAERASLLGTCVGPEGRPVDGARIHLAPVGIDWAATLSGGVRIWTAHEYRTTCGPAGTFRVDDLASATWLCSAFADGLWFEPREVVLEAGLAVATVEILGAPAASVRGIVTDAAQRPVAGARVHIRSPRGAGGQSDGDGAFALHDLPPRTVELRVSADGFDDVARSLDLVPGANEVRIELARTARLIGRARDESGAALAGWNLAAVPPGWEGPVGFVAVRDDGGFELDVGDREPRVFCVAAARSPFPVRLDELGTFTAGDEPIELVVPRTALSGATLVGSLPPERDDRAYLLSAHDGRRQARAAFGDCSLDPASGAFRIGPLPAGDYRLLVQVRERRAGTFGVPVAGTLRLGPYRLARGQTLDLGTLELPAPGRLECVLTPRADCVPRGVRVEWKAVDGSSWGLLDVGPELAGSWSVLPGEYDVTIWGEGFLPLERRVTVSRAGAPPSRLELTLEAGQRLPLALALPDGEERASFVVRDAAGRIAYEDEFGVDEARTVQRWPVLGRGRHRVDVTGASGRRFSGAFEVESLTATTVPLRFALRWER
jgi:protocatechuate 3,4-dioxygenase beta subunit